MALILAVPGSKADAQDPFPEIRPATRAQAIDHLLAPQAAGSCSAPRVVSLQGLSPGLPGRSAGTARALSLLQGRITFEEESAVVAPGGIQIRYATGAGDFDRLDPSDRDGDGMADRVQAVLEGLEQARGLLVRNLELPAPERLEVVLADLRAGLDGYVVPPMSRPRASTSAASLAPASPMTVVLDSGPGSDSDSLDIVRRAAIQAYAHAVALSASPLFPSGWSDALAHWASLTTSDVIDGGTTSCLSNRIERLGLGLLAEGRDLGAGNALWFAFLDEAYGATAVRVTVEELAGGAAIETALDRALRRATGDDLQAALREFHVWTVLVGDRADEHHFSFATELRSPSFASTSRGMPALSVQSDPAVGPTGATQVALVPDHGKGSVRGGLRILFEGEFSSDAPSWAVDLILLRADGTKHRLELELADGRGEKTVPLDGLSEAWMLIRNLGGDDATPRRYSYSAHHEKGFPFELGGLSATQADDDGVLIAWDTDTEHHLFGFDIVRRRESGGQPVIVNPLWIPALGDPSEATSYRFVDRDVKPGVSYIYTIQGITRDGLTSLTQPSDPVTVQPR